MRLSLNSDERSNLIRAYGPGWIMVNDQKITDSVLVMREQLVTHWPPKDFAALAEAHFEQILVQRPEIVLLGTGARQRFPHPRLSRALLEAGVGMEVMDTSAACRTYNIVMAEGRDVLAALLMI